jgi:hypothetical protein
LFGAAATLYEAYTGKPWLVVREGEAPFEVQMRAAAGQPFDPAFSGPPLLRAWFARALDPSPERRFGSAAEMLGALEALRLEAGVFRPRAGAADRSQVAGDA